MTGSDIITAVHMLLHDDSGKSWTETEIIVAINITLKNYANQLASGDSKYYYKIDSDTLTSGSDSLDLPDDCNGHIDFVKYNKELLQPAYIRDLLDEPGAGTPLYYAIIDNELMIYPSASSDHELTLGYWKRPTAVTAANISNDIDFPDMLAPIIVYDTAIFCAIKHEAYVTDIKNVRNEWYDNLLYHKGERIHLTTYTVQDRGDQ